MHLSTSFSNQSNQAIQSLKEKHVQRKASTTTVYECIPAQSAYLSFFSFEYLHLQIIKNIYPKASVETSSAQWAIFI